MSDYSPEHWSKRIPEYLSAEWSAEPTPFARQAAEHFPPAGLILELGAGAGQDGLWFAEQGFAVAITDATDIGLPAIRERAAKAGLDVEVAALDITKPFDLADGSLDAVYAQLVLNYFDDETMRAIMSEIQRVLRPGGVFAAMVNSTKDPEFDTSRQDEAGLIHVGHLHKRYFSLQDFEPFTDGFEALVFDENGRTPKDDGVATSGMVQFIGRKS